MKSLREDCYQQLARNYFNGVLITNPKFEFDEPNCNALFQTIINKKLGNSNVELEVDKLLPRESISQISEKFKITDVQCKGAVFSMTDIVKIIKGQSNLKKLEVDFVSGQNDGCPDEINLLALLKKIVSENSRYTLRELTLKTAGLIPNIKSKWGLPVAQFLPKLETLILPDFLRFRTLCNEVKNFTTLKKLDISHTQYHNHYIRFEGLESLKLLEELIMKNVQVNALDSLHWLKKLRVLDFSYDLSCPDESQLLNSLERYTLPFYPSLRIFNISGRSLIPHSVIHVLSIFENLEKLIVLHTEMEKTIGWGETVMNVSTVENCREVVQYFSKKEHFDGGFVEKAFEEMKDLLLYENDHQLAVKTIEEYLEMNLYGKCSPKICDLAMYLNLKKPLTLEQRKSILPKLIAYMDRGHISQKGYREEKFCLYHLINQLTSTPEDRKELEFLDWYRIQRNLIEYILILPDPSHEEFIELRQFLVISFYNKIEILELHGMLAIKFLHLACIGGTAKMFMNVLLRRYDKYGETISSAEILMLLDFLRSRGVDDFDELSATQGILLCIWVLTIRNEWLRVELRKVEHTEFLYRLSQNFVVAPYVALVFASLLCTNTNETNIELFPRYRQMIIGMDQEKTYRKTDYQLNKPDAWDLTPWLNDCYSEKTLQVVDIFNQRLIRTHSEHVIDWLNMKKKPHRWEDIC